MARRKNDPPPGQQGPPGKRAVVRRAPGDRKQLPEDLEAFARGDDDALWRRTRRRRLEDPRPAASAMVPGVANRDARLVFDARVKRLRALIAKGEDDAVAEALADVVRLGLWRANSVVGFDALAEAVLGLAPGRAREMAKEGARRLGVACDVEEEETIALWMRAEAGLLEISPAAEVKLLAGDRLVLELPLARAADALSGVGRRAAPLAGAPPPEEELVDRPRGVEPLSKIIERDRPPSDDR